MMLRNQKGISLIELIVVIGIFALAMSIMFVPQLDLQKRLKDSENKMGRIASSGEWKQKFATNSQELRSSSKKSTNSALCPCILGGMKYVGGTKECSLNTCTSNTETAFEFYEMSGGAERKLSGLPNTPVFYTANGDLCTEGANSPNCAYRISSTFRATCPGGTATCDHAESLLLTFTFTPQAGRTDLREESFKISYPVTLNYPPEIQPITLASVKVGETLKVQVNGGSGHASESNINFVFEKCETEPAPPNNILEVKCYRFVNGRAYIKVTGKATGTAKIKLQMNDGELEDSLSEVMVLNVQVVTP